MLSYIGCDTHISTCSFHVLDKDGNSCDSRTVATNGSELINYLRSIPGEKKLVIEETNLARWLYTLLSPEVSELVVCNPLRNHLLKQGSKTDKIDALKLAQLLRGGFVQEVFHKGDSREELRDLVSGYLDLIEDFVRMKNRYKALFRGVGIQNKGKKIYEDESFLKDLKLGPKHFVGSSTYAILQKLEEQRLCYLSELEKQSKKYPEIKNLKTIPGIGTIQACKIVSIVVSPERFLNKYKFYSYCGLVKHVRESGGKNYGEKVAYGNSTLKCVFRMAGQTVLRGSSGLRREYDQMMSKGLSSRAAYNAVCRKIASLSLVLWKKKERYRDDYVEEKKRIKKIRS